MILGDVVSSPYPHARKRGSVNSQLFSWLTGWEYFTIICLFCLLYNSSFVSVHSQQHFNNRLQAKADEGHCLLQSCDDLFVGAIKELVNSIIVFVGDSLELQNA